MPNSFNVHSIIISMALRYLDNELVLGNMVHRGLEKEWRVINEHKIGDTVTIDRPPRFVAVDGPDITGQVQDVVYGKHQIKLDRQLTVPFQFDARGLTTEADVARVGGQAIKAAASEMAQRVESDLAGLYTVVSNHIGTPGTLPSTPKIIGQGGTLMTNLAVPYAGRCAVLEPDAKLEIADKITTLFMPAKSTSALERCKLGPIHNFDTYESASLKAHRPGNWAAAIRVMGANQHVAYSAVKDNYSQQLNLDGSTAAAVLRKGDVFTLANVFEVNMPTRETTMRLRDFVVLADATTDGAGLVTVTISPPIIPADSTNLLDKAHATVTTKPADNAVVIHKTGAFNTPYRQNLLFRKSAFALITKPLARLDSFTVWEQRQTEGLSMTLSKGGNIMNHTEIWRLDLLYGVAGLNTDEAVRLTS